MTRSDREVRAVFTVDRVARRAPVSAAFSEDRAPPRAAAWVEWQVTARVTVLAGPVPFAVEASASHVDARRAAGAALLACAQELLTGSPFPAD